MPISLELFNFSEVFQNWYVKTFVESFQRLGEWLKDRVKKADALERSTSHIPVVRFYNESVTLWITESQHGVLKPAEPPKSFGDHLVDGGKRFLAGLADTIELPREALIIPRFFDAVLDGVGVIVDSVERWKKPDRSMFDTEARTASDLFGEAALAFRALASSIPQLWGFQLTIAKLLPPPKAGGPMESSESVPDLFERVTRFIVAGLTLVTILPAFVGSIWTELSIFLRATVIDVFAGVEATVFDVRRSVIDLFYKDLREALHDGLALAITWRFISIAWVNLFLDLSTQYCKQIFEQFDNFFHQLSDFIDGLLKVFDGLERLLADLLEIDVMPMLITKIEEKSSTLATLLPSPPKITLGDFAEPSTRQAADQRLQDWLTSIKRRASAVAGGVVFIVTGPFALLWGVAAGGVTSAVIESKLKPVRDLLNQLYLTKTVDLSDDSGLSGPLPVFPDIGDTFTTWMTPLRTALADFVPSLQSQTKELFDKGIETLDAIGTHFDKAAASALRGPSTARYTAIAVQAEKLAAKAFPASDVEGGDPNEVLARIADSWERWFFESKEGAAAGFTIVAAVIPEYIKAMRAYWEARQARGLEDTVRLPDELPPDFPTSPHIMALHPVLSRTLVPKVTIDATGHALDAALAERVAGAFVDRVQEAHRQGVAKLATLQAMSGV